MTRLRNQGELPALRDLLIHGNSKLYEGDLTEEQVRINVLRRLPNLKKINGKLVTPAEQDAAKESA